MKRRILLTLAVVVATAAGATAGTASADPSSNASCNGILTVNDAHNQNRDDFAHEVEAAVQAGELPNPGAFFSFVAQYHDGSIAGCLS
jgi:hypothetical protein